MLFAGGVNPFATLDPAPADGVGLNPLLQHPSMMIHPPMLYSGYVAFTVPFAFAIGALVTRRIDADWIRATRRFALIAWALLGFGLLLGARWSYTELGWGGYWAWDPVENAALMPWLIGTAFLHSIMVQEKRGMLKVWNACLIVATFSLALLGTFLVRSGVLQSIHAFGDSTVGPYILGLIAVVLIGSTALIVSRLDDLRSEKRIDSLISREAVFLVNNLLLVGAHRGDLLGHLLPADLGTVHRRQGLAGGALVRPLHDAAGDPARALHRDRAAARLAPGQLGLGEAGVHAAGRGRRSGSGSCWRSPPTPPPVPGRCCSSPSPPSRLTGLAQEFWRGAVARRKLAGGSLPAALIGMVARNRRRYGGYIVHAGVAVLLVGIAASSSFQTNRDVTLEAGAERRDRRSHGHLREADRRRRQRRLLRLRRGARASSRAAKTFTLHPSARFFRPTGVADVDDRELLRRRGDQRGRAEGRPVERLLGLGRARHRRRADAGRARPTRASQPASAAHPAHRPRAMRWPA